MKDKYFLDTNIFVYSFDAKAPAKRDAAQRLIEQAMDSSLGVISYQVVQEFLNVATRKFSKPLSPEDSGIYLDRVLLPLCEVYPSAELYRSALMIQGESQFSFYDSLIVAAAAAVDCRYLFSEDLQHGQQIAGLTLQNPFLG